MLTQTIAEANIGIQWWVPTAFIQLLDSQQLFYYSLRIASDRYSKIISRRLHYLKTRYYWQRQLNLILTGLQANDVAFHWE